MQVDINLQSLGLLLVMQVVRESRSCAKNSAASFDSHRIISLKNHVTASCGSGSAPDPVLDVAKAAFPIATADEAVSVARHFFPFGHGR